VDSGPVLAHQVLYYAQRCVCVLLSRSRQGVCVLTIYRCVPPCLVSDKLRMLERVLHSA
jgi:hypothetical protein